MPRAHRCFLPGHVWHITHRCHKKEFLLKFGRDRRVWLKYLFEAKKRYGLIVYNYMVTSNHIHLLVQSDDRDTVSKSMQLIAGRVAQEYNRRKNRKGAFWEDRYHATAVESGEHMLRCMLYIDMNMVRAGVVKRPEEWEDCGYHEVLEPKERYSIIDQTSLLKSLELKSQAELKARYPAWIEETMERDRVKFEEKWSQSIAVGSDDFVREIRSQLGLSVTHHKLDTDGGQHVLRENEAPYESNLIRWVP